MSDFYEMISLLMVLAAAYSFLLLSVIQFKKIIDQNTNKKIKSVYAITIVLLFFIFPFIVVLKDMRSEKLMIRIAFFLIGLLFARDRTRIEDKKIVDVFGIMYIVIVLLKLYITMN